MLFKSFIKNASPEAQQKVQQIFEQNAELREFKRGDVIYKVGDSPKGLYFVKNGLVGLTMTGVVSGREHLLRFFRSDQFFGHRALFSVEPYHATTIAIENTVISSVPREVVLDAMEKFPQLYKNVIVFIAGELRRCEEQHVLILENQILARVAQSVIYLKELYPDHHWTRQEIANFCASTVSTVIKALAELEDLGFIRQEGRTIEILNRDALLNLQLEE